MMSFSGWLPEFFNSKWAILNICHINDYYYDQNIESSIQKVIK